MTDDNKVVFLAYRNERVESCGLGTEYLTCRTCKNKTWTAEYVEGRDYPTLSCAVCHVSLGMFGWVPEGGDHDR